MGRADARRRRHDDGRSLDVWPVLRGPTPWVLGGRDPETGLDCYGLVVWVQHQLGREVPPAPWDGDPGAWMDCDDAAAVRAAVHSASNGGWTWVNVSGDALRIGDALLSFAAGSPHLDVVTREGTSCRSLTMVQATGGPALRRPRPPYETWRLVRLT